MISKDEYMQLKKIVREYEEQQQQVESELDHLILIGHLNKAFGFNGYQKIDVGSDVFLYQDRYFFYMYPLDSNKPPVPCKFYKETLTPCINFLDDYDRRNI